MFRVHRCVTWYKANQCSIRSNNSVYIRPHVSLSLSHTLSHSHSLTLSHTLSHLSLSLSPNVMPNGFVACMRTLLLRFRNEFRSSDGRSWTTNNIDKHNHDIDDITSINYFILILNIWLMKVSMLTSIVLLLLLQAQTTATAGPGCLAMPPAPARGSRNALPWTIRHVDTQTHRHTGTQAHRHMGTKTHACISLSLSVYIYMYREREIHTYVCIHTYRHRHT